MTRIALTISLVCLTLLAGVAFGQSSAGLPTRELVITGGQFTADTYIDVGAFTAPVFPLDDREWIGTPQLSMLCYSPRVSKETFSLFTHMNDVVYPIIWYYPLDYTLGEWKYEYGDEIICQLWECDGASDGCDPKRPNILPNAKSGDDLLGQATLSMGSYQVLSSHLLNMTVPRNGKGTEGNQAASFLIECKGCKSLWSRDPSWVNPFTLPAKEEEEKAQELPPVSVPAKETPNESPLPWRQGEDDTKTEEDTKVPEKQPDTGPTPQPADTEEPVEPFEGPVVPTDPDGQEKKEDQTSGDASSSGGGSNVLVIVLAVLGALVGLLVIAVLIYYGLKKWGWRRVDPIDEDPKDSKDENVARHLRIRVQRPADADAAIRQHRADGAMAELPWQPHTKH